MAGFPTEPNDLFDVLGRASTGSTFQSGIAPSTTASGSRQSRVPNNRPAVSVRKIMHWLVPEGPIIQMYINPQSIAYNQSKEISSPVRTKGGYVLQYWGERLQTLRIDGTTGTSGIEGINVLEDIYRNEQLAFDPYALFQAKQQDLGSTVGDFLGLDTSNGDPFASPDSFVTSLLGGAQDQRASAITNPPNLAALAFGVEMFWDGKIYRGFFTSFNVTERAENLGMFDYNIEFTVTQVRGFRSNFLPWHRSATSGPSNSNPTFGVPYSYSTLVNTPGSQPQVTSGGQAFSPNQLFGATRNETQNLEEDIANNVNKLSRL